MAVNLSELKGRIKATSNVAKLTGVMKMVASSKLRAAEDRLMQGRAFGKSLMDSLAMTDEQFKATEQSETATPGAGKTQLIVVLTTDRGLCGGVNSTLTRALNPYIAAQQAKGYNVKLFVLGEKGRAQIVRDHMGDTVAAIDSAFDKEPIFAMAGSISERIVSEEFDVLTMVYNEFINAGKFELAVKHFPQLAGLPVGTLPAAFTGYEVEPDNAEEALVDLMEYGVAGSLYYALMESQACEISQRVVAMENASTNSTDLVDRLSIIYNRGRQAKITTELAEIVSGAAASEADEEE
jgi:ATP synthase F1 gamma subunit